MVAKKPRKMRSDARVDTAEKRLGLTQAIRNTDGTNARGDKRLRTLRKEEAKRGKK